MKDIYLHGRLRKKFGPHYRLDVATPVEAGRALCAVVPGFRAEIIQGSYRVIRGDLKTGIELGPEHLTFRFGNAPLHIVPVIRGAKRAGTGKAILGVAIAAVAIIAAPASGGGSIAGLAAANGAAGATAATGLAAPIGFAGLTYGNIAAFGAAMALSGVAQMLAPTVRVKGYGDREKPDERPSYLFNGPVNVSDQGGPVPLAYGKVKVGSVVASAGLKAEDI